MVFNPRLVILCPPQVAIDWNFPGSPIASFFTGNNLTIRTSASLYTRILEGTAPGFIDGFNSPLVDRRPRRFGFSLKINVGHDELYQALQQTIDLALAEDTLSYNPITVWDYYRVKGKVEYQRGYAIRSGMLSIEDINGAMRRGTLACNGTETATGGGTNQGFTLKFLSATKELI